MVIVGNVSKERDIIKRKRIVKMYVHEIQSTIKVQKNVSADKAIII